MTEYDRKTVVEISVAAGFDMAAWQHTLNGG